VDAGPDVGLKIAAAGLVASGTLAEEVLSNILLGKAMLMPLEV
jgi:hypothetical protein